MRVFVIINPISGAAGRRASGPARSDLAEKILGELGVEVTVRITERPGHARELAREALSDRASIVCAWGGDGTTNEVASALAFGDTPLAIVAAGSGNGLARELGIPPAASAALRAVVEGFDRSMDVGELSGRLFFNVAGVGIDAYVARLFNSRAAGSRGLLPYVHLSAEALFTYRPMRYWIELQGETIERICDLIVIANSAQYGSGIRIAPLARIDDGFLDAVLVEARSRTANLRRALLLLRGRLSTASGVDIRRVAEMRISADTPILYHVDGETGVAPGPIDLKVHPRALRVRAPRGRPT